MGVSVWEVLYPMYPAMPSIVVLNKDMKNVLFFIFVMFSVIGRVVLCKAYLPEVHHQKYLKIK